MLPDIDHCLVVTVNQQSFVGPESPPCVRCSHYCLELSTGCPWSIRRPLSATDPVACPERTKAQVAGIGIELGRWGWGSCVFQEEAPAIPASGE